MSIATRTGDLGTTGLLFGRRVPKHHVRIEALGSVDELSAVIGVAKVALTDPGSVEFLTAVQRELITLMGELAFEPVEGGRTPNFAFLEQDAVDRLDARVAGLEAIVPPFREWDISGANEPQARLHVARAICRRAERAVWAVAGEQGERPESAGAPAIRPLPGRYLNRLADVLWLMARVAAK